MVSVMNPSAMAAKNLLVAFIIFALAHATTSQTVQRPLAGMSGTVFPATETLSPGVQRHPRNDSLGYGLFAARA